MNKKFQSCPICKHQYFTEWAEQVTSQDDVRVDLKGKGDYDQAGTNEFSDEFKVLEYVCHKCSAVLIIQDGKLIQKKREKT